MRRLPGARPGRPRAPEHGSEQPGALGPVHRVHRRGRSLCPGRPGRVGRAGPRGEVAFDFGLYWFKGQQMGTGQCPVKAYNRYLRELIHTGKANPSFVVSHNLPLDRAPEGYQHFDARDNGWTKVVLTPPPDRRYPGTAAPTASSGCPRTSAKVRGPRWGSNPARKATAEGAQAAAGDLPGQRATTDRSDPRTSRGHLPRRIHIPGHPSNARTRVPEATCPASGALSRRVHLRSG
jgi:hypothetical protein